MLFTKSTFSSRLCRNFRCFFVPLLPISDNFILISPPFYTRISKISNVSICFPSTHYDWAHCQCVSVSVHSSGFSNIFRFLDERLAIVFMLIWYQMLCCTVRYGVLLDYSMTFRRLCAPRF